MELSQLLKSVTGGYRLKESDLPVVEWGMEAGLGAFLYFVLDGEHLKSLSADVYERLRASYFSAVFSAQDQISALEDMLNAVSGMSFPVCVLKGMSVSQQYYPRPELRLMRDIDILVQQDDVSKIESALIAQGYRQCSENSAEYYQDHHHSMPFYHKDRKIWVEVHTGIFRKGGWRAKIPAFSDESIHREMMPVTFGGVDIMRLSPELQVVYIAAHWVEDFKPQGGLFALLDVMFLLGSEQNLDWEKLLSWTAESRDLARPVYLLLANIKRYQLAVIPDGYVRRLSRQCGYVFFLRRLAFDQILKSYYFRRGKYGKWFNEFTLDVIWESVCQPTRVPFFLEVLWGVVFPRHHAERYQLGWHWRRFRKFMGMSQSAG